MRPGVTTDKLLQLFKQDEWRRVLALLAGDDTGDSFYDELWLWVRPSLGDLLYIGQEIRRTGSTRVVSLGCGTGLLEWLLHRTTGLDVVGVEVNRNWWESGYAPTPFLPLHFADEESLEVITHQNSALMFCYFNDGEAFTEYLGRYRDRCLVIIGPGEGRGIHTCPTPFNPPIDEMVWRRQSYQELGATGDFVAVYTR
uniref:Class I SAM-dependent methyltransferase n=1 Tax=Timema tahoe TaxID=61484 RepID=A0A7R9IG41_9NEOP|nr:unnamed protein product [Timema tahoe]